METMRAADPSSSGWHLVQLRVEITKCKQLPMYSWLSGKAPQDLLARVQTELASELQQQRSRVARREHVYESMGGAAMVMVEGAVAGAKNPAHPRKLSAIEAGGA